MLLKSWTTFIAATKLPSRTYTIDHISYPSSASSHRIHPNKSPRASRVQHFLPCLHSARHSAALMQRGDAYKFVPPSLWPHNAGHLHSRRLRLCSRSIERLHVPVHIAPRASVSTIYLSPLPSMIPINSRCTVLRARGINAARRRRFYQGAASIR